MAKVSGMLQATQAMTNRLVIKRLLIVSLLSRQTPRLISISIITGFEWKEKGAILVKLFAYANGEKNRIAIYSEIII